MLANETLMTLPDQKGILLLPGGPVPKLSSIPSLFSMQKQQGLLTDSFFSLLGKLHVSNLIVIGDVIS